MITDSRQAHADDAALPRASRLLPECVVWEKLDPANIPGDPWRAVPNYNGYQPDAEGNLVFNPDSYVAADEPFLTYPEGTRPDHREGCMYDPQWDAADPVDHQPERRRRLVEQRVQPQHEPRLLPVRHEPRGALERRLGQRPARDRPVPDGRHPRVRRLDRRGRVAEPPRHRHVARPGTADDGIRSALRRADRRRDRWRWMPPTGDVLWEFQTGSGIAAAPVTYEIDGEQYVAVFAAGSTNPYGGSVTQGDSLWAFKLGGTYTTESGSQEGPDTAPLSIRRPVSGAAVAGETVGNTVLLARSSRTADTAAARDSMSQNAMQPTHLRVPVGTTVTFRNPGAETFPNFPNLKPHCATQFFEGEFNVKLQPGETYQHTFDRAGEYFFNDCTDPRPTGKIEVYLAPQDQPGALRFTPGKLDLGSGHGTVHRASRAR